MDRFLSGREIKFRLLWFVTLRYLATLALLLVGLLNELWPVQIFDSDFVWPLAAAMLVYNTSMLLVLNRIRFKRWRRWAFSIAHVQIAVDLFLLTIIVHYTGGIESPVLFFYGFHAVIASILLLRFEAYLHVGVAVILVGVVVTGETTGLLAHHDLVIGARHHLYRDPAFIIASGGFFAITMVLMVYMTSSLAREVGTREGLIKDTVSRLQMANEELRSQEKVRTQFVRTVSHDLKEPLASIQSTLRVVLDGYTGEVNPKAVNMIERADRSAAKLISMIRDMLDLGRMRSGWLGNRSVWPVGDLMAAVDEKLRSRAEEKRQSLTFAARPKDLEVNASQDALEQVLLNLVSNGLKYSPEKTPVRVWLGRRDGTFVMRVEDEGIGISAEDQKKLFSEFFRAGNARRLTKDGTGLGLSIVKSIVDQHGGTIDVTSPYQDCSGGTRIEVIIPWNEVKPS